MFKMSKGWEKFFYLLTFFTQGSSFLNPRAYAIMHRMHHAYSDTEKDPHSPHFFSDVWHMMHETKNIYMSYVNHRKEPEKAFQLNYPSWTLVDKIGDMWITRIIFALGYVAFYVHFAPPHYFLFLLLPIEFLMGPVQGAIVNWCGHKYGYSNYDNNDKSKNTIPLDFFLLGELFQNNHHKSPNRPNFAKKWFEFDPVFPVIFVLNKLGIIKLRRAMIK
jgi:stearoyl-CoA desaturase (delta-9 desaturase)